MVSRITFHRGRCYNGRAMLTAIDLSRVTLFCFAASYAAALLLELLYLLLPRPLLRLLGLGFGGAGLFAHTLFLAVQQPPLSTRFGTLLFLAWILAVFCLYGMIHHRRLAWGVFVLPLVLALVGLASAFGHSGQAKDSEDGFWLRHLLSLHGERFWGALHGGLLLLAAVGVCVGCVASVMYLVQARRLRLKTLPGHGPRLLSLERLEEMNRRAITVAFPLLTAGMLIGVALMIQEASQLHGWTDPRVLSTVALWLVFALLLYLRYGVHLRGRRVAQLTIVAFAVLLVTLAVPHTLPGGAP
jgi:ABC-type transport system involved in cytochrome c biogenesis permease subunit